MTGKIRGLLPYQPVYSSELSAKLGLQVERKERRVRKVRKEKRVKRVKRDKKVK